jgi:plasmid stabilization system protein ParE
MNYRVILSPDAEENIRAVFRWYLDIQLELSFRFRAGLKRSFVALGKIPTSFANLQVNSESTAEALSLHDLLYIRCRRGAGIGNSSPT